MTTSLTFQAVDPGRPHDAHAGGRRPFRWPIVLAAALAAIAAQVSACDKSVTPVASMSGEGNARGAATFTGKFVDGVPVYRLPAINVVGRRQAEIAKAQRNDGLPAVGRTRASSAAPAAEPSRTIARAARDATAVKPCIG